MNARVRVLSCEPQFSSGSDSLTFNVAMTCRSPAVPAPVRTVLDVSITRGETYTPQPRNFTFFDITKRSPLVGSSKGRTLISMQGLLLRDLNSSDVRYKTSQGSNRLARGVLKSTACEFQASDPERERFLSLSHTHTRLILFAHDTECVTLGASIQMDRGVLKDVACDLAAHVTCETTVHCVLCTFVIHTYMRAYIHSYICVCLCVCTQIREFEERAPCGKIFHFDVHLCLCVSVCVFAHARANTDV